MTDHTDGPNDEARPHGAEARLPKTPETTLRTALLVYAAVNGLSGLILLTFPRIVWDTIGGSADLYSVAYDSTRLAGGPLIALAVAALFVLRSPRGQHTLVTVMVLEAALVAAGGWWNLIGDDVPTNLWFEVMIPLVSTALAAYLVFARFRARKLLRA